MPPKTSESPPAQSAAALPLPEREENLIRSVLDMVSPQSVLDALVGYVRRANNADQLLATLALRGERAKPAIEGRSGPAWSTEEVGGRLAKSPETIRNRVAGDKLVGYRAMNDRTRLRLPVWQFHQGRETTVHPWVPDLLSAFGANGWALLDFVTVPRAHLDGSHYLSLLLAGRAGEVIAAAKRSNPD
jgi:hypothetical protein